MTQEIDCKSCSALCCGANQMISLTNEELYLLKTAGCSFTEEGVPKILRRFDIIGSNGKRRTGETLFFTKRCGFVVEKDGWLQCSIYKDPRRPLECGLYETGGKGCRDIIKAGCVKDPGWIGQLLLKILDL